MTKSDSYWFWVVFNRREGALKSTKTKKAARSWQLKNRPTGTRLVFMCIPGRDD